VALEVVLPTLGLQLAIVLWLSVVFNLVLMEETSEWVTMVVVLERDMVLLVGTVIVTSMKVDPQELHSWVLWQLILLLDIVGFVVDAGELHTHTVVRVQSHLTVKDVVDKVEQVEVVLLKLVICNSGCCGAGCPDCPFRPRKGSFFYVLL
jgi:hypothetical protein